jgi:hypothetical protein
LRPSNASDNFLTREVWMATISIPGLPTPNPKARG